MTTKEITTGNPTTRDPIIKKDAFRLTL